MAAVALHFGFKVTSGDFQDIAVATALGIIAIGGWVYDHYSHGSQVAAAEKKTIVETVNTIDAVGIDAVRNAAELAAKTKG
jgi:ABC-type sugar transport system substrate-binding protein